MNEFEQQLARLLGSEQIKRNEPLCCHTTFQIGGPADYFVTPKTPEDITRVIALCREHTIPFYVLGNGSNLLVGDKGYRGLILHIGKGMDQISFSKEGIVHAQAGVLLSKLANEIAAHAYTGFEFASGIPGSLGGAVAMNAGAYGSEMKDVLKEATILDEDNQIRILTNKELSFSYRNSKIQMEHLIVLEAAFSFMLDDKEVIFSRMAELNQRRKDKQPLQLPSAGSTFKRPKGYFAGKLIEDTGLRGYRVGGASISTKHCGFVVNDNKATAQDVLALVHQVDEQVHEKFGVHLEPEIRMIGEF
ncbi:MAG: UDP-N-acetylmuramate dehydrogenase [Clostridiales bacterium]|nr:UDP-N-acetylmuramate dehydrogenase [Clostridiales bacterium]